MNLENETVLAVNPMVVLREDFDDWAILFDADTGKGYSLNPTAVCIWKCLEKTCKPSDIMTEIQKTHTDIPNTLETDVQRIIDNFRTYGLIGVTDHGQ